MHATIEGFGASERWLSSGCRSAWARPIVLSAWVGPRTDGLSLVFFPSSACKPCGEEFVNRTLVAPPALAPRKRELAAPTSLASMSGALSQPIVLAEVRNSGSPRQR